MRSTGRVLVCTFLLSRLRANCGAHTASSEFPKHAHPSQPFPHGSPWARPGHTTYLECYSSLQVKRSYLALKNELQFKNARHSFPGSCCPTFDWPRQGASLVRAVMLHRTRHPQLMHRFGCVRGPKTCHRPHIYRPP